MSRKHTEQTIDALGFGKMHQAYAESMQKYEAMLSEFARKADDMEMDPLHLQKPFADFTKAMMQNPGSLVQANMDFFQDSMKLYQQMSAAHVQQGDEEGEEPVIKPAADDRRFRHEAWEENPVFKHIKDTYLLASKWARTVVQQTEGMDPETAKKVEFFTERYLDALSPTNFAATNPAVLEHIQETKGACLVHGLKNMLDDIEAGDGNLKIRMTDTDAFTLGENIATLDGKVVFQNRMHQLIQYTPTTEKAFKKPLLVVPPWINKYYILDLQPRNSFLKWLVDQGHTVFVISWVNPDESYREVGFDAYVQDGIIAALDAITKATGETDVNAIGYCLGGTLLATTMAYMAANDDQRITSGTFLTTMLEFSEPGDLGAFIGEEIVSDLEERMQERGFLDGSDMAGTFNLLRANDLIWSFYINNYLLGNDVRPFDLLYWNSDSTRMPAAMHSWYLRNMYMKNDLVKPNALEVSETPIDLGNVTAPTCFVSTVDDHIAPWLATYKGVQFFSGSKRFILGGSGHIAGIVNPPEANKYGYRVTSRPPADPEAWASRAKQHEGSWWPEWQRWVKGKSGKMVDPRVPGDSELELIEDAPGSYVEN